MSDCVPSPSSGSSYASSTGSNSSTDSSSSPSCEISLLERLIRTHPVWFLPSLQRSGALHLLQGREVGNFIVRSSTQPLTMAISVKLPGNTVEHYLLYAVDNRIALENSTHTFQTVHQLVAHHSSVSDEIPVCLRVPTAIAEATSRQQLRSLALLGQEFWTHSSSPSCGKDLLSPSDVEINKTFISSGLGSQSQSSSSQNSLSDSRKPCRPTTLELGAFVPTGVIVVTAPPVPPRWSRSALLTPLSLPSSIQSTPSEIQSTFSEKGGRLVKKKKRHSGSGKEPIHYKDTEILDIFKGTKTSYDDKASDYEDIWSPQYSIKSQTPQELPRLSTFKPDIIASSFGSDLDTLYKNNQKCHFQSLSSVNNNRELELINSTQANNTRNHRLSFNGNTSNLLHQSQQELIEQQNKVPGNEIVISNPVTTIPITPINNLKSILSKSKSSLYSEPVDSIVFRRFTNYRHSEPNIRWSQPAMMSLVNVDNHLPQIPQSPDHIIGDEDQDTKMRKTEHNLRSSLANVSATRQEEEEAGKENSRRVTKTKAMAAPLVKSRNSTSHGVTCVSVDNLCNFRDIRKRTKSKFNCGGGAERSEDEEDAVVLENKPVQMSPGGDGLAVTGGTSANNGTNTANKNIVKPKPAPRKRSTDLNLKIENEHRQEHEILDVSSTNRSWHLDNSWEFVNWEKGDEERMAMSSQKFPVQLLQDSSNNNRGRGEESQDSLIPKAEDEFNINHPSLNLHRFSRYDNLESRETDGEGGISYEEGDEMSDVDREEKISTPWDSSKWENLLRIVSESTQQLDSIQVTENVAVLDPKMNRNLYTTGRDFQIRETKSIPDSRQRISKILEVSGNVDKAGKVISSVVRDLAESGSDFFGPTLKSFISCTIAAKSQDPYKVMRNTRQFLSGMKNYLVGVSSESLDLRNEIKRQAELLTDCEFLNIDAILEEVLVDLVISPLNMHIQGLLKTHHDKTNEPLKLCDIGYCQLSSYPFAFTSGTDTMKKESYEKLKKIIHGFEDYVSPIKKLDKWNEFVCQVQEMDNYSSDSFLPLLSEVMSSVCSSNMASHVDFMIGLLPHSLAEQNNYSISLLQSALAALKSRKDRKGSSTLTSIRVIVPDERNGTLIRKMVPIRDTTTTKDVAKIVASKVGIANPGDYILVRIKNGEEKLCPDGELVSRFLEDSATALAYKRMDAKIGWPLKIT